MRVKKKKKQNKKFIKKHQQLCRLKIVILYLLLNNLLDEINVNSMEIFKTEKEIFRFLCEKKKFLPKSNLLGQVMDCRYLN